MRKLMLLSLILASTSLFAQSRVTAVQLMTPEQAAQARTQIREQLVQLANALTVEEPEQEKVSSLLQSLTTVTAAVPKSGTSPAAGNFKPVSDAIAALQSTWRTSQKYIVQSPADFDVANAALDRSLNVMTKDQVQALADKLNARLTAINAGK